jgi:Uma2 family endonuclease
MSQAITNLKNDEGTLPPARMTFEQFLARTDEHAWAEWVDGEVIPLTASYEHQVLVLWLACTLKEYAATRRTGTVLCAPFAMRCVPDRPAREPDVLFVRTERVHLIRKDHLEGPADLVVEVVGDDSRTRDRRHKFREYASGGVREYWLLDQPRKQAEFFLLADNGTYEPLPIGEDGIVRSAVLEGLWLDVEWLWRSPLPTLSEVLAWWQAGPKAGE